MIQSHRYWRGQMGFSMDFLTRHARRILESTFLAADLSERSICSSHCGGELIIMLRISPHNRQRTSKVYCYLYFVGNILLGLARRGYSGVTGFDAFRDGPIKGAGWDTVYCQALRALPTKAPRATISRSRSFRNPPVDPT